MDLQLVNTELTESRLYRNNAMGRQLTGETVARLLYLTTLSLYIMAQDSRTVKFARGYSKKTVNYGNYTLYRTGATDLYALAYHVNNPQSQSLHLKQGGDYLDYTQFDHRMHHRLIRDLGRGELDLLGSYLQRLHVQLRLKDARYGSWRRQAQNWRNMDRTERRRTVNELMNEIRKLGRGSEMLPELARVANNSTLSKVASTAAGAYVGHQAADKLGKSKAMGTGLGAIAGYWAAK